MQQQFEDLLKKHLEGTLAGDERDMLGSLLKDPANQLYLAAKIDADFNTERSDKVNEETGTEIFGQIKTRIKAAAPNYIESEQQQGKIFSLNRRSWFYGSIAVAASVLIIFSTMFLWNGNDTKKPAVAAVKQTEKPLIIQRHEINTSGKDKRITLSDGSVVILADKSELFFQDPFVTDRSIQLVGKASFKVFKDKSHPFTITSGEITTTALGTEFTVSAYKNSDRITVKLMEGKVVIRPLNKDNRKMKKEIFLLPGEEFVYNKAGSTAPEKKPSLKHNNSGERLVFDNPVIPENEKGSWYMFNNQLLTQVLDQLQVLYNVKILYSKKEIQNIYFTGKYEKTEPLENILNRIGKINMLNIVKNDRIYTINK